MIDIVFKIVDISLQISEKSRRDLYPLIWFRRNQGGVIKCIPPADFFEIYALGVICRRLMPKISSLRRGWKFTAH